MIKTKNGRLSLARPILLELEVENLQFQIDVEMA